MNRKSRILLKRGTLWQDVLYKTERAIHIGALFPLPTVYEFIEDCGIRFIVRILSSLQHKNRARKKQMDEAMLSGKMINPFLPYDENLFVSDISETHVALLNKFNVMEHHLLIVTRYFEEQEMLLTLQDFEALWYCMSEYNSLGFYNGGETAGASQSHKHLQMVPLPLAPEGPEVPAEPLFSGVRFKKRLGVLHRFPFLHVFTWLPSDILSSPCKAAAKTFEIYAKMLSHVGLESPAADGLKRQSGPYCLIMTRKWMFLVPRSQEFFQSISINSLGFAGSLFVRNKKQLEILKKHGPMTALKSVALSF